MEQEKWAPMLLVYRSPLCRCKKKALAVSRMKPTSVKEGHLMDHGDRNWTGQHKKCATNIKEYKNACNLGQKYLK